MTSTIVVWTVKGKLVVAGKPIPGILKDPHKWGKGQRINYAGALLALLHVWERATTAAFKCAV